MVATLIFCKMEKMHTYLQQPGQADQTVVVELRDEVKHIQGQQGGTVHLKSYTHYSHNSLRSNKSPHIILLHFLVNIHSNYLMLVVVMFFRMGIKIFIKMPF